jgi:ribonucleotide monophosphatase NagD (HAD superfamily)
VDPGKVLAIGDAPRTDIAGARRIGARAILVAKGIHAHELMREGRIDREALAHIFSGVAERPDAVIDQLRW